MDRPLPGCAELIVNDCVGVTWIVSSSDKKQKHTTACGRFCVYEKQNIAGEAGEVRDNPNCSLGELLCSFFWFSLYQKNYRQIMDVI